MRCHWAETDESLRTYHDQEWGVAVHDDRLLFELLNLEGAQAGLSWLTILKRRETYRLAFDNFEAAKMARYTPRKLAALLNDSGIIRNRLKIQATMENAKAFLKVRKEYGSFDTYIWSFVKTPLDQSDHKQAITISEQMSKALKQKGFKFVGATICYAFMQATGMINGHSPECFRYKEIKALQSK